MKTKEIVLLSGDQQIKVTLAVKLYTNWVTGYPMYAVYKVLDPKKNVTESIPFIGTFLYHTEDEPLLAGEFVLRSLNMITQNSRVKF